MKRVNLKTLVLGFLGGVLCTLCVLTVSAQFSVNSSKKVGLKPISMEDLKPYYKEFNATKSVVLVLIPEQEGSK